ncbi:MAG: DegT/DnrJ/EryC1/StrS family aminotransferase [Phycisphaerae bacterium]
MTERRIGLSGPDITDAEIDAVVEVMRSGRLSLGPKLPEFEQAVCEYTGSKYSVAVNSGTSALFLCLKAMGIGPGDEVITTPFTFIASVGVILQAGATPVLVDIDPQQLNMAPSLLENKITSATKAIEPVHALGNPWGVDDVCEIAKSHGLYSIEDSCEALGTVYKGKKSGCFGDAGFYGFYPNKQITTGEGGIMVTDDRALAESCISLRNQGRAPGAGWLSHDRVGYNFRLSDINCALGIVQLARIEEFKTKRKAVARKYTEFLSVDERLTLQPIPDDCDFNWFVYVVRLSESFSAEDRDQLMSMMSESGIGVGNYFPAVHLQPFMRKLGYKRGDFPVTESVSDRTIALPFHNNLPDSDIEFVCGKLLSFLDRL